MQAPFTVDEIWERFVTRTDVYAVQNHDNTYVSIHEPLTKQMIYDHINKKHTIGIFQHDHESNVKWICIDFDDLRQLEVARKVAIKFKERGYEVLIEFSGQKGYHVWVFFETRIPSYIAQDLATEMIREFGLKHGRADKAKTDDEKLAIVEIFPRTRKIGPEQFGNMVKLPFGLHQVSGKESYLIDFEEKQTQTSIVQFA